MAGASLDKKRSLIWAYFPVGSSFKSRNYKKPVQWLPADHKRDIFRLFHENKAGSRGNETCPRKKNAIRCGHTQDQSRNEQESTEQEQPFSHQDQMFFSRPDSIFH